MILKVIAGLGVKFIKESVVWIFFNEIIVELSPRPFVGNTVFNVFSSYEKSNYVTCIYSTQSTVTIT